MRYPHGVFSLVITTTVANLEISRILINKGSSSNIMYTILFEKAVLKKDNLSPNTGKTLQVFNGLMTCHWEFI